MIYGLNSALSGLRANANRMRVTSNNIANLNTPGFKKSEAIDHSMGGNRGVVTQVVRQITSRGFPEYTGNPLDVSIEGEGYFTVTTPDGRTGFSRRGGFSIDNQRRLTDSGGNVLKPEIKVPQTAQSVTVKRNGQVTATINGQETNLGQIELARFNNPSGLENGGGGTFYQSSESGAPVIGMPGSGGMGSLIPNSLEGSNVDLAQEIVNMIVAKHGYSANIKSIKAADELLGITINIKT